MAKRLFHLTHGIIPACDVLTLREFERILEETSSIEGIVGYKIGSVLALRFSLPEICRIAKKHTDLPLIYDHQKAGTDIPAIAEKFAVSCEKSGISAAIIFPLAGPSTEIAFIDALLRHKITPIVGCVMTHTQFLASEGGFIASHAPYEVFEKAIERGVQHFVLPANKSFEPLASFISKRCINPSFIFVGIGSQGGSLAHAFSSVGRHNAYAIIGREIYEKDIRLAARAFCTQALKFK